MATAPRYVVIVGQGAAGLAAALACAETARVASVALRITLIRQGFGGRRGRQYALVAREHAHGLF